MRKDASEFMKILDMGPGYEFERDDALLEEAFIHSGRKQAAQGHRKELARLGYSDEQVNKDALEHASEISAEEISYYIFPDDFNRLV